MKEQPLRESLENLLSEGQVVDRIWLADRGVKRPLVDYYLRSAALKPIARGAYRRPGPPLKWEHVVYSLQELGYSLHVGGRSALELQGYAHFLSMQGVRQLHVYGVNKLPRWVDQMEAPYRLTLHKVGLFDEPVTEAVTTKPFGHWDWPVRYATPELALLELAAEVKQAADFGVLDKLFDSATSLRPQLLTKLLMACHHVKAKRLFLWFAERHGFDWLKQLEKGAISLGSGKRLIVKSGTLDKKYLITVPRKMMREDTDGFDESFL